MDTFYSWLENHVAICTWVVASCSLLTFVLSFIFKKKKRLQYEELSKYEFIEKFIYEKRINDKFYVLFKNSNHPSEKNSIPQPHRRKARQESQYNQTVLSPESQDAMPETHTTSLPHLLPYTP